MESILDYINTAFTNYNAIVAGTDNSFEAIELADDDSANDYVSSSSWKPSNSDLFDLLYFSLFY